MEHCITCEKELQVGDTAYMDRYFRYHHCSWEHAVEFMADFFGLEEGEMTTLQENDYDCSMCDKKLQKGDLVYVDNYVNYEHCCWEHAVLFMADFFGLEEGELDVVETHIPREQKEEKPKWGDDL